MSSFDPENFGGSSSKGRNRDSYSDYNSGSSRDGEPRFRMVPLVLAVVFGIAAVVCAVMSYGLGGADLTADQKSMQSTLLMVGVISFLGLIVTARKAVRKR